ncbi:hypothetical protein J7X11_004604 [Vibrio parahaemolyticus]|nr:hypothetical protein [Vibrio parahaemolyticus]EHR6926761.1 hypothetical protein [Vibrio parahaemolyticus]EHW0650902.1 hypothetical protein [Vibrio parahaemolyticus]EIU6756802.1 hypothetical protein [Vibrio parahaemolyticus]
MEMNAIAEDEALERAEQQERERQHREHQEKEKAFQASFTVGKGGHCCYLHGL